MLISAHGFAGFVPGNTLLHRLDPRTKVLVVLAVGGAAVGSRDLTGLLILVLASLTLVGISRPGAERLAGLLRVTAILGCAAFLLNSLFTPGRALGGLSGFPIWPTAEGATAGLETAVRLITIAWVAFALVTTTSPKQVARAVDCSLGRLRPFHGAGVAVGVACRFIPELTREAYRMRLIRSVRVPREGKGPLNALRENASMLLPLVVIAVRRAERLADAMTARCYDAGRKRTSRLGRFTWADFAALAIAALVCVAVLLVG